MNTALLSPRTGTLAGWGLQRATRRNDRDRLLRRLEARAAAEAALAERDAQFRSSTHGLM